MTLTKEEGNKIIICECGLEYKKYRASRHIRTDKHEYRMKYINKGEPIPEKNKQVYSYYEGNGNWSYLYSDDIRRMNERRERSNMMKEDKNVLTQST
jgi:hypothetical protein